MAPRKLGDLTFDYDEAGDVLYVSFGSSEPYYCDNVDDILLVQRGLETGAVTGFQILDVKRHGIARVEVAIKEVVHRELEQVEREREQLKSLEKEVRRSRLEDLVNA